METQSTSDLISRLAGRYSVSPDAVRTVLKALASSGGTMAQFSHPEFGGMSQWSRGMTMVGDMFNDSLRTKLDSIATELASFLRDNQSEDVSSGETEVSYLSEKRAARAVWWPPELGEPSSAGAQNDLRYAIFRDTRRLVIDDHGTLSIYDTGEHRINGIGQAQGSNSTITFKGQGGLVRLSELKRLKDVSRS